jgi:HTH-type transcriptional regulator/antitoxin HigA
MLIKFKNMNIKVIKTEDDYNQALKRLEIVFDSPADTSEGDEADLIGILIEKYEDEHYPIEAPDPIEAIKFRMSKWIWITRIWRKLLDIKVEFQRYLAVKEN